MRLADRIAFVVACLMLATVGLAQPPVDDRRPFYVIGFLNGEGGPTPAPPYTAAKWRAEPKAYIDGELNRGHGFGFHRFLLHMPPGHLDGRTELTGASASLLPPAHLAALTIDAPVWARANGCSLWVYVGPRFIGDATKYRTAEDAAWIPSLATKRDWAEARAGWSPYLRAGFDGIIIDATARADAMPTVHALRATGFDGGYEPLAINQLPDGTFTTKSRAWYDATTITWDSMLTKRMDRYGGGKAGEWPGVDPAARFRFIGADGKPYGWNHVVMTAAELPHTGGQLDIAKARAIVDDYLARGWIVSCQMGGYPEHDELARYIAARQGATDMPTDRAGAMWDGYDQEWNGYSFRIKAEDLGEDPYIREYPR